MCSFIARHSRPRDRETERTPSPLAFAGKVGDHGPIARIRKPGDLPAKMIDEPDGVFRARTSGVFAAARAHPAFCGDDR